MKNFNLLSTTFTLIFVTIISLPGKAQSGCPGCLIDSSFTSYGYSPAVLPPATEGVWYEVDVTFHFPEDTLGLDIYSFTIASVDNVPPGMSWECNDPGCFYDPSVTPYGCMKVCGVAITPGTYKIDVTVVADVELVGEQIQVETVCLEVLPDLSQPGCFTASPWEACGDVEVTFSPPFTNTPPYQMFDFFWDFGDGSTSTEETPPPHFYGSEGIYTVTFEAQQYMLQLNEVCFTVNDNTLYCGDIEEPDVPILGCTALPDLYFVLTNAQGDVLHTSDTFLDDNSECWSLPGIELLTGESYSLTFWDEDLGFPLGSADDWLGTCSFVVDSAGNFNICGGLTTGNIVIENVFIDTFSCQDDITIHAFPPQPDIVWDDSATTFSTTLSGYDLQWFLDDLEAAGETGSSFTPSIAPGSYSAFVCASIPFGCTSCSDTLSIFIISGVEESPFDDLVVSPNPADNFVTVKWSTSTSGRLQLTLNDLTGKVLHKVKYKFFPGKNVARLEVDELPAGSYFLLGNDGENIWQKLFVKH